HKEMSRIIFSRLSLALIAALAGVTIGGFWVLPGNQQLPVHWNWHGVVDSWGPRGLVLLLLPIAAFAITGLFWTFGRWILRLDELHGGRQFALGLSSTLAVFFVVQLMIIG